LRGSSRGSSRRSSSTTTPRAGSSSTTPPPPCVRLPWHVVRLVMRHVAPLVVDYSASRRLVVDYFASVARPGASACRAARRAARCQLLCLAQTRRRILRLRRTSVCLDTSRGLSCGSSRHSSSTTPPRVGLSPTTPPRAARRRLLCITQACRRLFRLAQARRRQLHFAQARRRLLRLRRASGCIGTSRCSSSTTPPRAGSSSTISPPPRVWVPRHVARLVTRLVAPLVVDYSTSRRLVVNKSVSRSHVVDNSASRRLVVDYFASAARSGASAHRAARRRLLRLV
jgi:hypothetical protein